jgi:glycerophosphoryl diester phosphodiesterase
VKRWEAFNLNPRVNQGRQIDRLIAWTLNDPAEMAELVRLGVSGIITDDIPALRKVVDAANVPR